MRGYFLGLAFVALSLFSSVTYAESFLQLVERGLLFDDVVPAEDLQIDRNGSVWDVLVNGKKQALFITFPLEPKFEFAEPGFHFYRANEEGGQQRSYELIVYDDPSAKGFAYAQKEGDLSPKPMNRKDSDNRLAKSRQAAAQKVIEGYYSLRSRGLKVTLELEQFHDYPAPLNYTTGDWRVTVKSDDGSVDRESLVRVIVGMEKIYVLEVVGKRLFPTKKGYWGTDYFEPTTFVESIKLVGQTLK